MGGIAGILFWSLSKLTTFFFFFFFFFFDLSGWSGVHFLHDNASSHKCEVVKSFLNHPYYSPDLSPCDFFLFPRLKKMLSGNKYTSRSSLGSAIYQCLQTDTKRRLFICFSRLGKKVTKMCFSKGVGGGGVAGWGRYILKVCNKNMFDKT